jgi:hypothetical protein
MADDRRQNGTESDEERRINQGEEMSRHRSAERDVAVALMKLAKSA